MNQQKTSKTPTKSQQVNTDSKPTSKLHLSGTMHPTHAIIETMSSITIPELQNIKGIGNKTIDLIRQYIYKRDFAEYKPPKEIIKLERNGSYLGDCLCKSI